MEFRSYRSYRDFANSVTAIWRYNKNDEQNDFLQTLHATSTGKQETIPGSKILWRAQVGHDWGETQVAFDEFEQVPCAFSATRMKPLKDRAPEGRVNPKGIPYLYLATDRNTAIAEVRPWIGVYVSVAQLTTVQDLRVVNCASDDIRRKIYIQEPSADERERQVWRDIDQAFAEPVSPSDDYASYVPTQIIAEFFRQNGFDGLAYRSSLGPGRNIALFDLDAAEVVKCSLVQITSVALKSEEVAEPLTQ